MYKLGRDAGGSPLLRLLADLLAFPIQPVKHLLLSMLVITQEIVFGRITLSCLKNNPSF